MRGGRRVEWRRRKILRQALRVFARVIIDAGLGPNFHDPHRLAPEDPHRQFTTDDPPLDEPDKGSDTTNVNDAVDVPEFPSVAVTVNVVDVNKTVGVPDICPVEVSKVNPVGRAGDIEYSIGDVPPDAVIGVNAVAAVPLVKDLVDTAVDAVIGFIVTEVEKVAEAVSPLLSVAVTV